MSPRQMSKRCGLWVAGLAIFVLSLAMAIIGITDSSRLFADTAIDPGSAPQPFEMNGEEGADQVVGVASPEHYSSPDLYRGEEGLSFSLAELSPPAFPGGQVNGNIGPNAGPSTVAAPVSDQGGNGQDASLGAIHLVADEATLRLSPAFNPGITRYGVTLNAATVDLSVVTASPEARVMSSTPGGEQTHLDLGEGRFATTLDLTEGATTEFSLTVKAGDGATTMVYYIDFSRPVAPELPDVTFEGHRSEYVAGMGIVEIAMVHSDDTASDVRTGIV